MGGPDGARDIEAVFANQEKVWGAVGFRKNATDDSKDKRWVQRKFQSDVDAAKEENPSLSSFIFFTNIDLTPGERAGLEQYAHRKGVSRVEFYYRERLQIALDSPQGMGLRLVYLDIDLSPAEQRAFFAEYGKALEGMYRFLAQIKDSSGGHRHRSLWIGGQDAFRRAKRREDGSPVLVWHIDFSQSTPPKKQD